MGTVLLVRVAAADTAAAWRASEVAIAAVEQTDDLLSTWREDSELARLNRAPPGDTVALPPVLADLLHDAERWSAETNGAFDPTVGALVDAWGLRGAATVPAAEEREEARRHAGWRQFGLGPDWAVRRDGAAWVDSGGFGKGAALRAARDALTQAGVFAAFLNFGGQILGLGPWAEQGEAITVADPVERARPLGTLALPTGSAATTSQSERHLEVGGRLVGHVLDPRTGEPVPAWGSVTVVDPDPLRADVLATALFVLGPDDGWSWAEHRNVQAVFVLEDGESTRIRYSRALEAAQRVTRMGGVER